MDGEIKGTNLSTPASFNIIMPSIVSLSGYHAIDSEFAILWSAGWTDFSKVQETSITMTDRDTNIARGWEDTFFVSVGAHYQLDPKWRLEGGVYYETSPQDDPTMQYPDVPTGELWKFGTGASYHISNELRMQLYYEFFYGGNPEIEYNLATGTALESQFSGEYSANIHYFGVLMNYEF
ncbi:outer membrane protein transport protein [Aliivibrio kagoshimensis]